MTRLLKQKAMMGFSLLILAQCLAPRSEAMPADPGTDAPRVIVEGKQQKLLLPPALEQLLLERFRTYFLPTRATGGQWSQFSGTRVVPYATWGDFNGDGLTDVALLLTRSLAPREWRLSYVYVFCQDSEGRYSEELAFKLDDFSPGSTQPRPIQSYRLTVHKAGTPIRTGELTLPYTYPLDSIALVRLGPHGDEIDRVYAWDPKLGVIRRTILDALGKEAVVQSPVFDRPQVVGSGAERTVVLPWALEALLQRDFSDLRLPGQAEMSKSKWPEFTAPNRVPWATWGDYSGNGLTDIALMLVDAETGGAKRWSPVAFLQTDNHSFEAYGLERFREWVAGPDHRMAGKTFPPTPPQVYVLVTVPAGTETLGFRQGWRKVERYRFDTIFLIAIAEWQKPVDELNPAIIREWMPRWKGFYGANRGDD